MTRCHVHSLGRLLVFAWAFVATLAQAQLTIEIIGGGATTIPIAIVPFAGEANYPYPLTEIVGADLARSGLFKLVDATAVNPRPARVEDVRFGEWTSRGADAVVVGSVTPRSDGKVEVRFFLVDAVKQTQLAGMSYVVAPAQFRATAHRIADVIYEKLTGDVGVFSTRIAYIAKQGPRYQLLVAEADGFNPQTIVTSNEPLLSPVWSPDGSRIAYVSLENKKPIVYIQSLATGQRQVLANFRGSNSAPAWAPDGNRLVVTLSRDGSSQLYMINADGSGVSRLMNSPGIDTEANFAPDGKSILFTSDRGGSPQIYRLTLGSGAVERMTFDGTYNVSPRHLPNGKLMLYASEEGARGILAAVSSDGRVKQRLSAVSTDVREPAWGPLQK